VAIKNLASERVRIGMTQTDLAKKLGTSTKSISLYESDQRTLPPELAIKAADLFGCSIDYLYGRTNDRLPRREMVAD
jgi:transcriptional regulator with XRE-family HTH domain